ncbi:MAG: PQQ-binding-like beta-propeller repeat protein [Deltaproteobacteria bacterium]|nr:PQQ-binding-like beta-propeller repeat protein [Deltaproteobacteria bacterium]
MITPIIEGKTRGAQPRFIFGSVAAIMLAGGPAHADVLPLVLVPSGGAADQCPILESIAASVAMTSGVRLVRAPLQDAEALDAARRRVGADLAFSGAINGARVIVERAYPAAASTVSSADGLSIDVAAQLSKLWPKDAPRLQANDAFAAGSLEALRAACAGDAPAAYARAGAALGEALRARIDPPPEPRPRPVIAPLLVDWAQAEAALRRSERTKAVPMLRRTLDRIKAGESAPLWRQVGPEPATAIQIEGDTAIEFARGSFVARSLASGLLRWRVDVGAAEPRLVPIGSGLLLAATEVGLIAIEGATGKIAWRVEAPQAWPEVLPIGDQIVFAAPDRVLSVHRVTGAIVWRASVQEEMIAGPILTQNLIGAPGETAVFWLDPKSGQTVGRTLLGDELAAPLFLTPSGSTWALVGADRAVRLGPQDAKVELPPRALALRGATWPPFPIGDVLLVGAGDKKRGTWISRADATPRVLLRGVRAPLLLLPDKRGVVALDARGDTVVAVGPDGRVLWKARMPAPVAAIAEGPGGLWVAAGNRLSALEPSKGKPFAMVVLSEPVRVIAWGDRGGLALATSGAVYGLSLPDDPRPSAWAAQLRRQLASTYLGLGLLPGAELMAKELLQRDPDDPDALALAAKARSKRDPRGAVAGWLALLSRTRPTDPARQDALAALDAQVGLTAFVSTPAPVSAIVTSTAGLVAAQAGGQVLVVGPDGRERWSRRGTSVHAAGAALGIDDRWYRALDGSELGPRVRQPEVTSELGLLTIEQGPTTATIGLTEPGSRAPRWRVGVPLPGLRVLDVDPRRIALESSGLARAVAVIDVGSAAPAQEIPVAAPVQAAQLASDQLIAVMGKELAAIELGSAKIVARTRLASTQPARLVGAPDGALLIEGRAISLLGPKLRLRWRTILPSAVALAAAGDGGVVFVALEDGTLLALKAGQLRGRIATGPIAALAASGGTLFVAPASAPGLWVFDSTWGLQAPRRSGSPP